MLKLYIRVMNCASGVTATEYSLIAGLVGGAVVLTAAVVFGNGSGGSAGSIGGLIAKVNAMFAGALAAI